MTRWDYFPLARGPCGDGTGYCGGWQITSYFGSRVDPITGRPGNHGGEDLAYAGCSGAHIYAPSAGTLAQSWDPSGGGNWSGVTLDDGSYFGIGHAQGFAPGNPYRRVAAGELIAYCGTSGNSTGPHAHVAYRPPGAYSYADPYDLLMDSSARIVGADLDPIGVDGMPKQMTFPEGDTYVLIPAPGQPHGWAWQWIDSPQTLGDTTGVGAVSSDVIKLACEGSEGWDAVWNHYAVLSGPQKGTTRP